MSSLNQALRVWPLFAIRAITVLLMAMAVAQVLLAGSILDGYDESLTAHMMIGIAMVVVALILTVFSGIALAAGASRWMLISAALLTVVLAVQVYVGLTGMVGLHVPLGVLLVTGIVMQTVQAFKPLKPRLPAPAASKH